MTLEDYIDKAKTTKEKLMYTAIQLFSTKGYGNVGIRTLCRSVGIKESSFYNHFSSKDGLFKEITELLMTSGDSLVQDETSLEVLASQLTLEEFMRENTGNILKVFSNPVFLAIMRLVVMESYINETAYSLSQNNNYQAFSQTTLSVLKIYQDQGQVSSMDLDQIIESYYYGLSSFLDTYMLNDAWGKDQTELVQRIYAYTDFYTHILKKTY